MKSGAIGRVPAARPPIANVMMTKSRMRRMRHEYRRTDNLFRCSGKDVARRGVRVVPRLSLDGHGARRLFVDVELEDVRPRVVAHHVEVVLRPGNVKALPGIFRGAMDIWVHDVARVQRCSREEIIRG